MNSYIMAIDAGTGSIRAILYDEHFNQIAVAQQEWTHPTDPNYAGAIDFDVATNKVLLFDTIRQVIAQAGISATSIKAISSTSMREAFVLYDQNQQEIWAVSNVDARAIDQVYQLKASHPTLETELYQKSGQTFALGAIPRLLWLKKHRPDIYQQTKSITMLNDWIVYCLTGILAVEPSNASTSGILNSISRTWDHSIIEACSIKPDIFPPVHESGTAIGTLLPNISHLTGLSPDCLVVAGGGDVQMGCLGVGAIKENQAALLGGSFWQLEYNTASPSIDIKERIRVNCHAVPNMWQQELIAFYPGLVLRWFRDAFCQYEKQQADQHDQNVYDILNAQAEKIPVGCYGMSCSFSSVMDFKHWQHPAPLFTGFTLNPEQYNKATFYRCLLENAALVTLGHKKIIEDSFGAFPAEIIFASGASVSSLWCQIVADALGVTVKVPIIKEATALGAAFCAGLALNRYPNFEVAIEKYVVFEKTYFPNPTHHTQYLKLYQQWEKISNHQLQLSQLGVVNYLWQAPGL